MNSLGYTIIRYDQGKLIKFSEKVALKKLFENRNFETVTTQLNLRSGIDLFIEDPKRIQVLVLGGECRVGEKVFSKGDYYCHIHPDQLLNICSVSEEVNILVVSSTDLASCLQEIKNTNNDHQYYADFTALYALDVLSRQEKAGLERHMQSCRDCVREVEDFSAVVSDLGFALEARKPSSKVKESLLAKMSKASFEYVNSFSTKLDEGTWIELSEGIFQKALFTNIELGIKTLLYRMLPGSAVEPHFHHGIEECFVVDGCYDVGSEWANKGDYICADAGTSHEKISTKTGTLLFVSILEQPNQTTV